MDAKLDLLIPLNQDTMDRHLSPAIGPGGACVYNADTIKPADPGPRRPALSAARSPRSPTSPAT
jgi:Pyruvate/2-oxoacid:ferredoxin oxidoreductase gamma subunit